MRDEKIIISLTSWIKRIGNCKHTIELMLKQTMLPDKIVLNLSSDEFVNKENDLPKDLCQLINDSDICELYWVKENTKPYKKLIPSLYRFPNDIIITIDDDLEYPNIFIESMYNEYLAWGKQCPIVGSKYEWWNGIYNHFGCYSLVKKEFFGEYLFDLYENLYLKNPDNFPFSDPMFTYAVSLNGRRYKAMEKLDMDIYRKKSGQDSNSLSKLGSKNYITTRDNEHKLIREYIQKKYNKTYDELFSAPIYVNITTWKKRDMYLPKMLEHLQKQTKKPDKIILWLSKDEYDENNLPKHITDCLNKKLLSEIRWVDRNIYCHKRHEVFRTDNDVYNMFMDDDLYYEPTYIETLYSSSLKHPNSITAMAGSERGFSGSKIIQNIPKINIPNIKNAFLGGLTCYPPYSFPIESYNYTDIRDTYATKCDETWVYAWCIKKNIKVNLIKPRNLYKLNVIDGSDKQALWNENKVINRNTGLTFKEGMFHDVIHYLNLTNKIKTIFPSFKPCAIRNTVYHNTYNEKLIVTMTSWKARIGNIPAVLDTIFKQTKQPDKIVINLSTEEFPNQEMDLPEQVVSYINNHSIVEINWVDGPNTKQWKKILPTLKLYPNDCIVCIDDDFIYPNDMLSTLWNAHIAHPNNPISGNQVRYNGIQCQCGCASLVKLEHLKNIFDYATPEVQKHHSSDIFFTYVAAKGGTPYIYCGKSYFTNMSRFNEIKPLHGEVSARNALNDMWNYLVTTFGNVVAKKKSQPIQSTNSSCNVKANQDKKAVQVNRNLPVYIREQQGKKLNIPIKQNNISKQVSGAFGLPLNRTTKSPSYTPVKYETRRSNIVLKTTNKVSEYRKPIDKPKEIKIKNKPIVKQYEQQKQQLVKNDTTKQTVYVNPTTLRNQKTKVTLQKQEKPVEEKKPQVILKQDTRVLSRRFDNVSKRKMEMANRREIFKNTRNTGGFFR